MVSVPEWRLCATKQHGAPGGMLSHDVYNREPNIQVLLSNFSLKKRKPSLFRTEEKYKPGSRAARLVGTGGRHRLPLPGYRGPEETAGSKQSRGKTALPFQTDFQSNSRGQTI